MRKASIIFISLLLIIGLSACSGNVVQHSTSESIADITTPVENSTHEESEQESLATSSENATNLITLHPIEPIAEGWRSYELEVMDGHRLVDIQIQSDYEMKIIYTEINGFRELNFIVYNIQSNTYTPITPPVPSPPTFFSFTPILLDNEILIAQNDGYFVTSNIVQGTVQIYDIENNLVVQSESFGGFEEGMSYHLEFIRAHFINDYTIIYAVNMIPPIYAPERFGFGIMGRKQNIFIETEPAVEANIIQIPTNEMLISFSSWEMSNGGVDFMLRVDENGIIHETNIINSASRYLSSDRNKILVLDFHDSFSEADVYIYDIDSEQLLFESFSVSYPVFHLGHGSGFSVSETGNTFIMIHATSQNWHGTIHRFSYPQ